MNIEINNQKEEGNNFIESNLFYNNENEFFNNFPINIFKNISKEEFNERKCNFCDRISLYPKVFKNTIDNTQKIICNNCYERLNKNNIFFKELILEEESSNILKQINGNYIVCCPNLQCDWEGKLSKLKNHMISECKFQTMKCPNKGCNQTLLKKDLNSHLIQCIYDVNIITINCNFCKKELKKIDVESHFEICPEVIKECDKKCGKKIKRKNIELHQKECPEVFIKCKYWNYGCKKIIKRKYIQDHYNLEIYNHYNLVNNSLKNIFKETEEFYEISNIIKELEEKIKEREKKIKDENKRVEIKNEIKENKIEYKEKINEGEKNKNYKKCYKYDDYIPFIM